MAFTSSTDMLLPLLSPLLPFRIYLDRRRLWDARQNVEQPAFAYALRVVPSTADQYQAWRLNPALTSTTTRQNVLNVKVDNSFESKYTQGDVKTGRRNLNYLFGADDRLLISPTTSYPWCEILYLHGMSIHY